MRARRMAGRMEWREAGRKPGSVADRQGCRKVYIFIFIDRGIYKSIDR